MKKTLQGLVAHCAGDNGSHCAILETLAVSEPAAAPAAAEPAATLKQVKPGTRRAVATKRKPDATPATVAHAGLMAWAHSLPSRV